MASRLLYAYCNSQHAAAADIGSRIGTFLLMKTLRLSFSLNRKLNRETGAYNVSVVAVVDTTIARWRLRDTCSDACILGEW
jgi:hypothetical protein